MNDLRLTTPIPVTHNVGPGEMPGRPDRTCMEILVKHWDYDADPKDGFDYYRRIGLRRGVLLRVGVTEVLLSPSVADEIAKALATPPKETA